MLSFFSKKKPSPGTPPAEEIIQGPADPTQNNSNGEEFIFVEKKSDDNPKFPEQPGMYPPIANIGLPYPNLPMPGTSTTSSTQSVNPLQGVPFQLAPQLCSKSTHELTQTQVDGILALLTRQMSVTEEELYNFNLERSIQNEY